MKIKMYKNVENNQTNMSSRPGVAAPSMFSQFSSDCVERWNPDAKIPGSNLGEMSVRTWCPAARWDVFDTTFTFSS